VLTSALLLLADSRLPSGAHAHSGGVAAAVAAGSIHDEASLMAFLTGRLHTAGAIAAGFAYRAAILAEQPSYGEPGPELRLLDAELDARTPSAAARAASRAQGRGLLRAASRAWPSPLLALLDPTPQAPVAWGVAVVAAGGDAHDAATVAAAAAISGPASAALRLLGLDPLGVTAVLASLGPAVDAVAQAAVGAAELPAASAPLLDHLAQAHERAPLRLFAS